MWKYVSRRVKDTIELGINVRQSFNLIHHQKQQQNHQQQHETNNKIIPRHQDPSRDKDKSDEKFKRKYHRLHHNQRCFLNALTWSTALITGFYASQLLCLYRRNHRLAYDGSRCYYSKYLVNTTQSIHKNVKYLLTPAAQQSSFLSALPKLECPFKKAKRARSAQEEAKKRTFEDEFADFKHFVDPEYKKYEQYFENGQRFSSGSSNNNNNVYNISNDKPVLVDKVTQKTQTESKEVKIVEKTAEEKENDAIDNVIGQLAGIVGELEFQMGLDSILAGRYDEAVDHFTLSTRHNHPGGVFNLALCYEQGMGVKKNMKTARRLYEIASSLGNARASYNLGVFYAQGLGGVSKNFTQAKQYFEQAAVLGSTDALDALKLLLPPPPKKLPIIEEIPDDEFFYSDKMKSSAVSAIANQSLMRRIAIS